MYGLKSKKVKKGFSLLELIVVIVIMAILVGLSAPKFMGKAKNAKVSAFKNDVETLQNIANVNDMSLGLDGSSITSPYGIDTVLSSATSVSPSLITALENNTDIATAYSLTADDSLTTDELNALGLATLNSDNFKSQIGNKLKDNDLTKYLMITKGDYAGTILYNNEANTIVDENDVRYFGVELTN